MNVILRTKIWGYMGTHKNRRDGVAPSAVTDCDLRNDYEVQMMEASLTLKAKSNKVYEEHECSQYLRNSQDEVIKARDKPLTYVSRYRRLIEKRSGLERH